MPRSSGPIYLVEPEINPISAATGLSTVANYPPLAQARLAGQLADHTVRIFDLRIAGEKKRFFQALRQDPPSLVGISTTFSSNGEVAIELASQVRERAPKAVLVLGGTAPSEEPMAFYDSAVDFICLRSGDRSLPALADHIQREGRPPERPPGFFYRENGTWQLGPAAPEGAMDQLKPFGWHLLPRHYWRNYYQAFRTTGMSQLSEGCPYDCNFCSVWITHGRRIALANLENIKHDFNSLPMGTRGFFFADDIWMQGTEAQLKTLYDPLLEWLSSEFLPRRRDLTLTAETRTDLFLRQQDRFREWVRRGHLQRVFFGVEAVTDQALKNYSKRNTTDHNSAAMKVAHEMGIHVTAQLVIPLDADEAYFDEIVRFWEEHREYIRSMYYTIATPLPGTVLYNDLLRIYPDLADRNKVRHPAFSLYTALVPTRLPIEEFYRQVARVFRLTSISKVYRHRAMRTQVLWNFLKSPWLVTKLARSTRLLQGLTRPEKYLEMHRAGQGERLLSEPPLQAPLAAAAG